MSGEVCACGTVKPPANDSNWNALWHSGCATRAEIATGLAEAKRRFLATCSDWADLLIEDSRKQVQERDGDRWQFVDWHPRIVYDSSPNSPVELPESQAKVWSAGYALLTESYDVFKAEK